MVSQAQSQRFRLWHLPLLRVGEFIVRVSLAALHEERPKVKACVQAEPARCEKGVLRGDACTALSATAFGSLPRRRSWMALIIIGSSGGRCGRSGSALPVITIDAGRGARGASKARVSAATNMRRGFG